MFRSQSENACPKSNISKKSQFISISLETQDLAVNPSLLTGQDVYWMCVGSLALMTLQRLPAAGITAITGMYRLLFRSVTAVSKPSWLHLEPKKQNSDGLWHREVKDQRERMRIFPSFPIQGVLLAAPEGEVFISLCECSSCRALLG